MRDDLAEAILATTAALVVVLDPAGRVVRFNAACEALTGYAEGDVLGQVLWPFVLDPDAIPAVELVFAQLLPGRLARRYENQWRSRTGTVHQLLWSNTELLNSEGQVEFIVATGLNVTEERQAQRSRLESEARFRALFEGSADGVVLVDPHDPDVTWPIIDCNEAFCQMNGYTREALIGQPLDLLHEFPLMAQRGEQLLARIRAEATPRNEWTHKRQDGSVFPIETVASLITIEDRELVLGLDRDISQRKLAEAQLQSLSDQRAHDAQHDALTGLPNRALLYDRLAIELARVDRTEKTLAVVFIDLDGFKRVNDTLGHAAGDCLLQEVARRLQGAVRPSDTVGRMGGDEFVVLIPDFTHDHDVLRVVQRMQRVLAAPLELEGQVMQVRSSIGITQAPAAGGSVDVLLSQADQAMYQAKRAGTNELRFFSSRKAR